LRCSHWCPVDERKKRWLSTIYAERATMAKEIKVVWGRRSGVRGASTRRHPSAEPETAYPPGFGTETSKKLELFFVCLARERSDFSYREMDQRHHTRALGKRERERVSSSTETRDGRWEKTDGGWPRNKLVYPPFPVSRHKSINMMHFFPLP
jgi:hypothetical protein